MASDWEQTNIQARERALIRLNECDEAIDALVAQLATCKHGIARESIIEQIKFQQNQRKTFTRNLVCAIIPRSAIPPNGGWQIPSIDIGGN